MKILGIGNAIVDVICKVDESFLSKNNLTKSTMKLVDETEFKKLLSNLKIEQTIAGGSVANSIVGLSQLGNAVSYTGKVNNDDLGNKILQGRIDVQNEFNIQSTPSFLINGNLVQGNKSVKEFRQIIDKILSE